MYHWKHDPTWEPREAAGSEGGCTVLIGCWQQEESPTVAAETKRVGATILFADEASIRFDYQAGTTWVPTGVSPIVEAIGRRFSY